jgi:putative IMPACT (imprinted ancient) family translation regulator
LGKGGLVKAYSGGVQLALESLPTVERVPSAELAVIFGYPTVTPFQRMLPDYEAEVLAEEYGVDVTVRLKLPLEQVEPFTAAMQELTNGDALVEVERADAE